MRSAECVCVCMHARVCKVFMVFGGLFAYVICCWCSVAQLFHNAFGAHNTRHVHVHFADIAANTHTHTQAHTHIIALTTFNKDAFCNIRACVLLRARTPDGNMHRQRCGLRVLVNLIMLFVNRPEMHNNRHSRTRARALFTCPSCVRVERFRFS